MAKRSRSISCPSKAPSSYCNGRKTARKPRPQRYHHSVYVVLLSKDVLYERKFVKCNPNYDPDKPCVYVGMTGQSPDVRFDKHKAGLKSNRYVKKYGLRLMPELRPRSR